MNIKVESTQHATFDDKFGRSIAGRYAFGEISRCLGHRATKGTDYRESRWDFNVIFDAYDNGMKEFKTRLYHRNRVGCDNQIWVDFDAEYDDEDLVADKVVSFFAGTLLKARLHYDARAEYYDV